MSSLKNYAVLWKIIFTQWYIHCQYASVNFSGLFWGKKYFVSKPASYIKYNKSTWYTCIIYLFTPKLGINGMISDTYDCKNKNTSIGLSCSKEKKKRTYHFLPNAKCKIFLSFTNLLNKKILSKTTSVCIDSNLMQWVANHLTNKLKII
jgi:hypothetical protein